MIWLRRTSWMAFFALLALFLCHSWFGPDIWYHLTWGRSLLSTGSFTPQTQTLIQQPIFANIYWLFQSLMFFSYRSGGIYLVSFLFACAWLAIAALWLKLSGLARHPLGPWVALAFFVCCQMRFEQRPEVFSYLLLMIFLWRLSRLGQPVKKTEFVLLFVLQALWTGLHSYFALGPLLALAFALAQPRRAWRSSLAIFASVTLGSLASPFGWSVWETVWAYSQVGTQLKDLNQELFAPSLLPLYWPLSVFWLLWLTTVLLALRALIWRRQFTFAALVALGGALLAAQAVRNIPLVALMSAPLWPSLPTWRAPKVQVLSDILAVALSAVMAVACVNGAYYRQVGSLGSFGVHEEWASYPIGAVDFLRAHGFHGRIFCDSYDGGYLEFALPEVQVAGDSYFADPDITRSYFAAIRDPQELGRLHERLKFDALLINIENLEEIDALLGDPRWALVYNDSHRALFLARPATEADPAKASYWHGESLRNWTYAFGPISWAAMARKHNWPAVLTKILQDVEPSPDIPSTLIKQVLSYAVDGHDRALAQAALNLLPRLYISGGDDEAAVRELAEKAKQCCR